MSSDLRLELCSPVPLWAIKSDVTLVAMLKEEGDDGLGTELTEPELEPELGRPMALDAHARLGM